MRFLILLVVLVCAANSEWAYAGAGGAAVKAITRKLAGESIEATAKTVAKQAAEEAAEKAAKEVAQAAVRRTLSTATQHFGKAVVNSAPKFADDLALATSQLSSRNGRRLMMMAPKLAESGQAPAVVAKLASGNGDLLIETLWKHREKVGAAAVVTGLLVHGDDIVNAGGEYVAKPVIESVVAPVSRLLVSGVILVVLIGIAGLAASLFGGEATERVTGNLRRLMFIFTTRA